MKLTKALVDEVADLCDTTCTRPRCQAAAQCHQALLLHALASVQVTEFTFVGEHPLHPGSIHIRPVFQLTHLNGRTLRMAFTGLSTVQVFSNRRNRSTHCHPHEFATRLHNFIIPTPVTK